MIGRRDRVVLVERTPPSVRESRPAGQDSRACNVCLLAVLGGKVFARAGAQFPDWTARIIAALDPNGRGRPFYALTPEGGEQVLEFGVDLILGVDGLGNLFHEDGFVALAHAAGILADAVLADAEAGCDLRVWLVGLVR